MKSLTNCTVTVLVSNLDAAIAFYVETLGLELKTRYGEHYAEIQGPGLLLGLHPTEKSITSSDNLSIGFGVQDFDAEVQSLRDKGFDPRINREGFIRLAHFRDPDQNPLYLAEMKEQDRG